MPDIVLTSDVIVGFPGETEAESEDTLQPDGARCAIDALFTFIFSPRAGTPAAQMHDPAAEGGKDRPVRPAAAPCRTPFPRKSRIRNIGKTSAVLWTAKTKTFSTARTEGGAWCASPATIDDQHITDRHDGHAA